MSAVKPLLLAAAMALPALAAADGIPTRSRRIVLPFRVEARGPAAVAKVRLYATRDGGRTWSPPLAFGAQDPVAFEAPEDGAYGFTLVGEDEVGHAPPAPVPDEAPQITFLVDTKPPSVALEARPEGDVVRLTWKAEDPSGIASVRVESSTDGGATWQEAARTDKGSAAGSALWRLPAGRTFLRAVARDAAGNRGESEALPLTRAAAAPSPPPPSPSPPPPAPIQHAPDAARAGADVHAADSGYRAAGIHRLNGRKAEAEASYRRAVAADPGHARAWNDLGALLFECGRRDEAVAALREAVRLCPRDKDMAFNLDYLLKEPGR